MLQTPPKPRISIASCYYCANAEFTPFLAHVRDRLGVSDEDWQFVRCTHCHSALLSPRPDTADLAHYYPAHYTFELGKTLLNRLEYELFYKWVYTAQARIVLRLLKRKKTGKRIVDIGCGSGHLLREFKNRGFTVEGIDMRQQTGDIPIHNIELDQLESHYGENSVDIILLFHIVEHLPDPAVLLSQCFTILKPGGAVLIATPLSDSLLVRLLGRHAAGISEAPRHLSLPSRRAISQLCKTHGFGKTRRHADASFNCAAGWGLSLFPGGATGRTSVFLRLCTAASAYVCLPLVFISNVILRRPANIILAAFKP